MTIEEAEKLLRANEEIYWKIEGGVVKLDGRFTVFELEAIITLMPMTATEVLGRQQPPTRG